MIERAIGYARVSTSRQERDGTSLETQEQAIRVFCAARGYLVVEIVAEAVSGTSLHDRPGIQRARDAIRAGAADVLVGHAIDRIARDTPDLFAVYGDCRDAGGRLELVTEDFEDTPLGRHIVATYGLVAELENIKRVERTTRGRRARIERGEIATSTFDLYGYRTVRLTKEQKRAGMLARREIVPDQAAVVAEVFQRVAAGESIKGTADLLTARGVPSPGSRLTYQDGRKAVWQRATVKRMVENSAYMGQSVAYRWKVVKGRDPETGRRYPKNTQVERPVEERVMVADGTPVVVDRDLWEAANARLKTNRGARTFNKARPMLLRGKIRCQVCGGVLHTEYAKTEKRRQAYRCRGNSAYEVNHPNMTLYSEELDEWCWTVVEQTLAERDSVVAEIRRRLERVDDTSLHEQARHYERHIEALDRQKAAQIRLVSDGQGIVTFEDVRDELARIAKERDEAERGLTGVRGRIGESAAEQARLDGLDAVMRRYGPRLADPDHETKVEVIGELGLTVVATRLHQRIEWALPVEGGTQTGWAAQIDLSDAVVPDEVTQARVRAEETAECAASLSSRTPSTPTPAGS